MSSKSSSRRNSLEKMHSRASSQASSASSASAAPSSRRFSTVKKAQSSHSSRASSIAQKSSASSRRSSTDSNKSLVSVNESLFSHTGSQLSADSVRSGVITALCDRFSGLEELPSLGSAILDDDTKVINKLQEEAAVNRSGRAGVKQFGFRQINKRVDNNKLRPMLADYTPRQGWIPSQRQYRLRHTHKDPDLGTDQLVVDLGSEYGTYTGPSSAKYTYGKRSRESRGFSKVADSLGLRPGTLDRCNIKKVSNGFRSTRNSQDNALWNAFDHPETFTKQVNAAALKTTAGIVGLKGKAAIPPVKTSRKTKRDFDSDDSDDEGIVTLDKGRQEHYLGHRDLPEGKLSRTFMRMPNKPRDLEEIKGGGMQKEMVKVANGEIVRKSRELVRGRLPKSDEPLENILEDTWRKMTPDPSTARKHKA